MSVKTVDVEGVEVVKILGGSIKRVFVGGVDSNKLDFALGVLEPGEYLKKHYHPNSDEVYFVLEGEGKLYVEDREEDLRENQAVLIPSKVVHGVRNTGSGKLVIAFFTAPGTEKLVEV